MSDRWKQRFGNFENALNELRQALNKDELSLLELAGTIQLFQLSFELGWKLLKDLLEREGFSGPEVISSPRRIIQTAVKSNILSDSDGYIWLEALDNRNSLAHVYDKLLAQESEAKIKNQYFPVLEDFFHKIKKEIH
ncbi:MAG: HI0074 family nucleotidyltransferase substrate-binding subunit [Candidatus Caenarcaniphilales bacterium]|nr:HI0074 family nucleotidyltransferase substrate-binding subunit [Candidatus Caenarcaniphilales bacterium]